MANEVENALKAVATKISAYVDDIATLSVETKYIQVGADGAAQTAHTAAKTVIKLDGDSEITVPLQAATGPSEVDNALFGIHQRNVATAIDYRARMLAALLEALRGVRQ